MAAFRPGQRRPGARCSGARALAPALGFLLLALAPAHADEAVGDYFRGKAITLVIGFEPGGSYDIYAKLVANRLGAYIPGRPPIRIKAMPSAGGFKAAGWLYNQAPRDGTAIGTIGRNAAIAQAFGDPHAEYDARRFVWIARIASTVGVEVAWHTSKVKTIKGAMNTELMVGATAMRAASGVNPLVLNRLTGTKFLIVSGYAGVNGILDAMARGELEGGYASALALTAGKPEWLAERKVSMLVQYAETRHPAFPNVPTMVELARNPADKQILALLASGTEIGRSFVAPPGVPPEGVAALRNAFAAMMADPKFGAEIAARKLAFNPLSGEALQKTITRVLDVSPAVAKRAAEVATPPGTPKAVAKPQ